MKHALSAALVAAAVLVAACSGGGGGSTNATLPAPLATGSAVPAAGPVTGTRGTISLVIPTSTIAASARRAQFVSSAANSAVVTVNGGGAASYDVSPGSVLCSAVVGGRQCQLAIGVANGTTSASVTLSLFTGTAGLGALLGSGSGSTLIPANAPSFNVAIDISPIVAGVTFTLAFPSTGLPRISILQVESGTATLTYTDPGGAVIPNTSTSTFATPVTLSVVDPSNTVTILPATVTNAAQAVTVNYTGGASLGASVTFNAARGATPLGTLISKTSGFQTSFPLAANRRPNEITVGSDGNLWFTEFGFHAIAQMNTAGTLLSENQLPIPGNSPQPVAIAAGPAGDPHVWYTTPTTGQTGSVGLFGNVVEATGATTDFFTGVAGSGPYEIHALGSNLWISLQNSNKLYISDTSGNQVASSPVNLPGGTGPGGLAVGPDGNMYVTGFFNGTILAFAPTAPFAQVVSKPVPAGAGSQPIEIVAGPDNAMWFTEEIGTGAVTNIGRLQVLPSVGSITEFPLPAQFSTPFAIALGSDNGIWFGAAGGGQGKIVRIDPVTHALVGYTLTGTTQAPPGLVSGPDGNLWATDFVNSVIIRIQP
jgi:streptogramin lyase